MKKERKKKRNERGGQKNKNKNLRYISKIDKTSFIHSIRIMPHLRNI